MILSRHHLALAGGPRFDCLEGTGVRVAGSHLDLRENAAYTIDKLDNLEILCDPNGPACAAAAAIG